MSEPNDTAPAAETERAEPTSMTDILDRRDTHEGTAAHEGEHEVGTDPAPAPAAAAAAPAATSAQPATTAATVDPADDPRSPKWFREEMKASRQREMARDAEIERLRAAQPGTPRAQPRQSEFPNPAEDPQGYHEAVQAQQRHEMRQFQLEQTVMVSERFARQQHGSEAFEDCKAWLSTQPKLEAQFLQEPDPWTAAFAYYNREKLVEEIGDESPAAYRKRIEDEAIARYEARLQEQQQHTPASATMQRRAPPPAPASTARSAAPERDRRGQFAGPTPISAIVGKRRG